MVSKAKRQRLQGAVTFDATEFFRVVKSNALRWGFSPLKSAIYATLALEECMNDLATKDQLPFLATIGAAALPEVERLEPANEEEAQEKRDLLEAYDRHDKQSLTPLLDQWRQVQRKMNNEG